MFMLTEANSQLADTIKQALISFKKILVPKNKKPYQLHKFYTSNYKLLIQ